MPLEQIDWKRSICGCRLGDIGVKFVFDFTANNRLVEESFKESPLTRGGYWPDTAFLNSCGRRSVPQGYRLLDLPSSGRECGNPRASAVLPCLVGYYLTSSPGTSRLLLMDL